MFIMSAERGNGYRPDVSASQEPEPRSRSNRRRRGRGLETLVASAMIHGAVALAASPEARQDLTDTTRQGYDAARHGATKLGRRITHGVEEHLIFESKEQREFKAQLHDLLGRGEEPYHDAFFYQAEQLSGGQSDEDTRTAWAVEEALGKEFSKLASHEPNRLKVLHEMIQSEGDYDAARSSWTQVRLTNKGNCDARAKHLLSLIQRVYPDMELRLQYYRKHVRVLALVEGRWYALERPTPHPLTEADVVGTVVAEETAYEKNYLGLPPRQRHYRDPNATVSGAAPVQTDAFISKNFTIPPTREYASGPVPNRIKEKLISFEAAQAYLGTAVTDEDKEKAPLDLSLSAESVSDPWPVFTSEQKFRRYLGTLQPDSGEEYLMMTEYFGNVLLEIEKWSVGYSDAEIAQAKKRLAEIRSSIRNIMNPAEEDRVPRPILEEEAMRELVYYSGRFDPAQSQLTDLLLTGVGNSEARAKLYSIIVASEFTFTSWRLVTYKDEVRFIVDLDQWYEIGDRGLEAVNGHQLQGTVITDGSAFVEAYLHRQVDPSQLRIFQLPSTQEGEEPSFSLETNDEYSLRSALPVQPTSWRNVRHIVPKSESESEYQRRLDALDKETSGRISMRIVSLEEVNQVLQRTQTQQDGVKKEAPKEIHGWSEAELTDILISGNIRTNRTITREMVRELMDYKPTITINSLDFTFGGFITPEAFKELVGRLTPHANIMASQFSGDHLIHLRGKSLDTLKISSSSVADLSWAEGMSVRRLDISDTGIVDLRPLAKIAQLDELYMAGLPITRLDGLENKPQLRISILLGMNSPHWAGSPLSLPDDGWLNRDKYVEQGQILWQKYFDDWMVRVRQVGTVSQETCAEVQALFHPEIFQALTLPPDWKE